MMVLRFLSCTFEVMVRFAGLKVIEEKPLL
jgi:hypothetical protein